MTKQQSIHSLQDCWGVTLSSVVALLYQSSQTSVPEYLSPQKLTFIFLENNKSFSVYCDSVGNGLVIDDYKGGPLPANMGESGLQEMHDVSERPPWSSLVGLNILEVRELWASSDDAYIGFLIVFSENREIYLFNNGDELYFTLDIAEAKRLGVSPQSGP